MGGADAGAGARVTGCARAGRSVGWYGRGSDGCLTGDDLDFFGWDRVSFR